MKCPICGSQAIPTNMGRRIIATTTSVGAGLLGTLVKANPQPLMRSVYKEICQSHDFICSECGHKFSNRVF